MGTYGRMGSKRSRTTLLATFAGLALGATASQCAWQDNERFQARLEDTGKPALHAVHGERLRTLMQRLNSLMFERQRTQVDIDQDRRRYADETAKTADELLNTVQYIEEASADLKLNEKDQRVFLGLQEKLKTQLVTLRDTAKQGDADALPSQFNGIVTTCNACHSAFRDLEGEKK